METDVTKKPTEYSSLALAYLGDAVYELFVRRHLLAKGNYSVNELHKAAVRYVQAKAQSDAVIALESELTEEELRIYKRGRNAKPATLPKHANVGDYHRATGFEALIGYLYLQEKTNRLLELMDKTMAILND
ncbi:MAG: ribonuclease III [Ruminococcaceae bacterium]|nr:ribonuclease III [Oscillospiraceae bacterium]